MRWICLLSLVLVSGAASAQTVDIDDFDSYSSSPELRQVWTIDQVSPPGALVELFPTDAVSMPNSMALSTGALSFIGASASASVGFSPPLQFLQGTLSFSFKVTTGGTIPANQIDVEVVLSSGANSCVVSRTRPSSTNWSLVAEAVGLSCDNVDLAAVTELSVQVVARGPVANLPGSAFVLWDDLAVTDAVPVELMHFEVE